MPSFLRKARTSRPIATSSTFSLVSRTACGFWVSGGRMAWTSATACLERLQPVASRRLSPGLRPCRSAFAMSSPSCSLQIISLAVNVFSLPDTLAGIASQATLRAGTTARLPHGRARRFRASAALTALQDEIIVLTVKFVSYKDKGCGNAENEEACRRHRSRPVGPRAAQGLRSRREAKGAEIPEVVCFEKQADWGGLWNYTWRTGLDEHGEPVHGSMYRYLWSNGPKECLEFADYTFEEHFGRPIGSYPPRAVLWDYIKGRVEKSGVRKWVRFNIAGAHGDLVGRDARNSPSPRMTAPTTVTYSEEFDYVVVASGHFSMPNVPYFEGFETFNGRVLHSHDFRDATEFKGKDVLVVGRSYSAEDIGSQCYKYGAKSITVTYRSKPMGFNWPEGWEQKPLLQKVVGKTAHFKDGSTKDVDAIILCTGYLHHFPFLTDDLKLKTDNRMWPLGLYKGVVWEKNPALFYIGMQDQFYTFNMFDAQAWYARDVILGRIKLPSADGDGRRTARNGARARRRSRTPSR